MRGATPAELHEEVTLSLLPLLAVVVTQPGEVLQDDVKRYGDDSLDPHASDCNVKRYIARGEGISDRAREFFVRGETLEASFPTFAIIKIIPRASCAVRRNFVPSKETRSSPFIFYDRGNYFYKIAPNLSRLIEIDCYSCKIYRPPIVPSDDE